MLAPKSRQLNSAKPPSEGSNVYGGDLSPRGPCLFLLARRRFLRGPSLRIPASRHNRQRGPRIPRDSRPRNQRTAGIPKAWISVSGPNRLPKFPDFPRKLSPKSPENQRIVDLQRCPRLVGPKAWKSVEKRGFPFRMKTRFAAGPAELPDWPRAPCLSGIDSPSARRLFPRATTVRPPAKDKLSHLVAPNLSKSWPRMSSQLVCHMLARTDGFAH